MFGVLPCGGAAQRTASVVNEHKCFEPEVLKALVVISKGKRVIKLGSNY